MHFVVDNCESIGSVACGSWRMQELECELDLCRKENNNLRRQVRCYRNKVDDMCQQEYEECHDCYERHGSYDRCKWCRTSTEVIVGWLCVALC